MIKHPDWVQRIAEEEANLQGFDIVTGEDAASYGSHVHCRFIRDNTRQGGYVWERAYHGRYELLREWADEHKHSDNFLINFI